MTKFIELTDSEGVKFLVNTSTISTIIDDETDGVVVVMDNTPTKVSNTFSEVCDALL